MTMKHIGISLAVCAVVLFFAGCGRATQVMVSEVSSPQLCTGIWAELNK